MLANKNLNYSPVKENISPEKFYNSPQKQTNTIHEMIRILRENNIPIPSQLLNIIKNKKSSCQLNLIQVKTDPANENKKLKLRLSDIQFELKKIEEDFAEYKVVSKIERQKIIKKLSSEIESLKKKIEEDNNNWQKRFFQTKQNAKSQKTSFQQKISKQLQQKINENETRLKRQYENKINELQSTVKNQRQKIKQMEQSLQQQRRHISQEYNQKSQKQIIQIKTIQSQRQKQITKKLQKRIESIQKQKKDEGSKYEETMNKYLKENDDLRNEIYYLKKSMQDLNGQFKVKERKILQLQLVIRAKEQVAVDMKQQWQSQKVQIGNRNEIKISEINKIHDQNIKELMGKHLDQLDSFYKRINNLQMRKSNIEDLFKDQIGILEGKFNERLSKPEDLDEIQRLKTIVMLKERELFRFQDQLKNSEMQRQNNQKNYTKIFSSHSSRRKSANSHRDRQAFFKQTNATDLKLLLKICNKEF